MYSDNYVLMRMFAKFRLSVAGMLLLTVVNGLAQEQKDSLQTAGATAQTKSQAQTDSLRWEQLLDGVTVKAQRQLVKTEIDRIGYDVQGDEESKTQNVLELLKKVPLVTVDGEDNILVRGNSQYKIYKNGHYDPSLSKNAKEIFRSMPANMVKRVEVITDPGAREDAEGVNAVLNIVMMDNSKMDGVTGTVTGGYTSLEHPNLNTFLTTQLGKAIISFDYGYGKMTKKETENHGFVERAFVESGNIQRSDNRGTNGGNIQFADIDASYDIDSLNLLSASFGGYFYKLDVEGDACTVMFHPDRDSQLYVNPTYSYNEHWWMPGYGHHSWNGQLDYEHKTHRKGEQLTLSYMLALTRQHTEQENSYTQTIGVPFDYIGFISKLKEKFNEHTFQIDYVRPLWEGHKFEMGAKYIHRRNSSRNSQQFYESSLDETNDQFNHTTQIEAAYLDYLFNKDKWSARAGLRYEHSYLKAHYPDGQSEDYDKHLNDWVPQVSVKYQFDDRRTLKLSYTTSISRPGISYLNSAVTSSPSRVEFGNARLGSARDQRLALSYMFTGQRLTFQIVPLFQFTNNGIGRIIYADNDVRYSTVANNLRQHRWQLEGYLQWKIFDSTTFTSNFNFTDNHARNRDADISQHATSLFYYLYLSQKLPWKLTFTAYTYGQAGHTPQTVYAYDRSWNRYGCSLQRSFLSEDRLTVRLTARAPFHKHLYSKTRTTQGDIIGYGSSWNAQSGQQFQISVSYRFGKLKASVRKADTTIENSDVVGGIVKGN